LRIRYKYYFTLLLATTGVGVGTAVTAETEVGTRGVVSTLKSLMSAISGMLLSPIVVPETSGYPEGISMSNVG